MSILDTFYILFKSDASQVKKTAEEIKKSNSESTQSFEKLNVATDKVGGAFLNTAKSLGSFITAALSVHAIISGFRSATDYSIELGNVSRLLGVNAEQLDAWGNAVQRTGGTATAFQGSLRSLAEHLGATPQIALRVLPQLADVFHRIGRFQSFRYGKMLGLDEATILLLQQGRREVEAVIAKQKELGLVSQQDAETSIKFKNSVVDVGHAFRSLYVTLGQTVLPILTQIFDAITPMILYLREHTELIKGALLGITLVGAAIAAPFVIANATIIAIIAGVTALIALFSLAYEDIQYFLDGNDSLTGDILKKWPMVGKVIGGIISGLRDEFDIFLRSIQQVIDLFGTIKNFFGGNNKLAVDLDIGQQQLSTAALTPISSQTSNALFQSRSYSRNTAVNTGPIAIHTQATDAVGISKSLNERLQEHFWHSNSFNDNGVVI